MRRLPFRASDMASIGTELEFQIVHPNSFALVSRSKDLIRNIKENVHEENIKPEITQSMIEINSSVHHSAIELYAELKTLRSYLKEQASNLNILLCGGGTHPFQKWAMQKIFPTTRYKNLSRHFRYLSKQSTVFGQHVHIGCKNPEDALYLTHALTRYAPQFIAMSCASPFYQGVDTGYHSTRLTIFTGFPSSGVIPYLTTWETFSDYFYKMKSLKIIESMKDLYWDIRPKPEFGTVEVRVCDTPLTIEKAAMITAYIQTLSLYLLEEKPIEINPDLYHVYHYNRFEACRYGYDGNVIDPISYQRLPIISDIEQTIKRIEPYAKRLNNTEFFSQLTNKLQSKCDDATTLRQIFKQKGSLVKMVEEQCKLWSQSETEQAVNAESGKLSIIT
jgi:carboxylate-amine ligase